MIQLALQNTFSYTRYNCVVWVLVIHDAYEASQAVIVCFSVGCLALDILVSVVNI